MINNIVYIDPTAKLIIDADDTSMLFTDDNADNLVDKENSTLQKLGKGFQSKLLKINTTKMKAVVFRPKNKSLFVSKDIALNSCKIEIAENFKIVGVILFSKYGLARLCQLCFLQSRG